MIFDLEKVKTSEWVEYVLCFVTLWIIFPQLLIKSLVWSFYVTDYTVGHFVNRDENIFSIAHRLLFFVAFFGGMILVRCVIHAVVNVVAQRWHRVHYTV